MTHEGESLWRQRKDKTTNNDTRVDDEDGAKEKVRNALQKLHEAGYVHGDIHAGNIV